MSEEAVAPAYCCVWRGMHARDATNKMHRRRRREEGEESLLSESLCVGGAMLLSGCVVHGDDVIDASHLYGHIAVVTKLLSMRSTMACLPPL